MYVSEDDSTIFFSSLLNSFFGTGVTSREVVDHLYDSGHGKTPNEGTSVFRGQGMFLLVNCDSI